MEWNDGMEMIKDGRWNGMELNGDKIIHLYKQWRELIFELKFRQGFSGFFVSRGFKIVINCKET